MGINQTIGDIVKEACRKRGLSLNRLALKLGVNPIYLNNVLYGKKSSRPLICKIAETLHLPDLPNQYEIYLASRRVENKSHKPTPVKKGSKKSNKSNKSHKGGVS
ncbi:helix-turn-helix domain-containing protein [Hydrogenobacter thermophilus]|nr:helix-turn-helix transcriptional regulator [Hydrogenobacter thermophilus]